jgi:hypothetical protein
MELQRNQKIHACSLPLLFGFLRNYHRLEFASPTTRSATSERDVLWDISDIIKNIDKEDAALLNNLASLSMHRAISPIDSVLYY